MRCMSNLTNEEEWQTRREKLMNLLMEGSNELNLNVISREMGYRDNHGLVNDIKSVAKSLKNKGLIVEVIPAYCLACNFKFKQTEFDFKIPSRCPRCKEERIEWPRIKVVEK